MSEYFFGLGRGKVSEAIGKAVDKVARKYDAYFVWGTFPGDGPRYWFATRNQGEPFDRARGREVLAAVEAAGLRLPGRNT